MRTTVVSRVTSAAYKLGGFVLGMFIPGRDFWFATLVTMMTLAYTWWNWVTFAPPYSPPDPFNETFRCPRHYWGAAVNTTRYYLSPITDVVHSGLREPPSIFNIHMLLCFTTITTSWTLAYYISRFFSHFSPIHYSAWVDWWLPPTTIVHEVQSEKGRVKRNAREFRDIFTMRSFMLEKAYLAKDNLHKFAARRRLAAFNMGEAIAKRLGLKIHDAEMSRRSAKRNLEGSRTLMCAKDACSYTAEELKYEKTKRGNIVFHIDTFTHKDLRDANHTLSDGNIHYIYTWNPESVAGTSDELKFHYDESGNFITEVEGSKPYTDRLWDFEGDCLITHSYELSAGYITRISIMLALSIFAYNIYVNRAFNQTLYNLGIFYVKTYEYAFPYPMPRSCNFTNFEGYLASFSDAVNDMPVSWLALLEGVRYPCITYESYILTYFKVVQSQSLTGGQWLSILTLLVMALAGSYTPFSISHKVIRLDVGEHRCVVVVVPNCKFRGFASSFRSFLFDDNLRPRVPIVGVTGGGHKFVAERRKQPSGYSLAFIDSTESHFVKDTVYDLTRSLTTDKGSPSISNVRVSSKNEGDEAHRVAAALAIAIAKTDDTTQRYSSNYGYYPLPTIIRQDDESKADGDEVKEVMAHGTMPPIVTGGAYIHARSEAQTRDFVQRRLKDPAAKIDSTITPEIALYIFEFAMQIRQQIGGCADCLEPISEQEYAESRSRNQLKKFSDVMPVYDIHNYDDRKGFMKREVLQNPAKAARGICTFPPESQALGGRIALAYAAAMKACPWMACGLTPVETQEAVVRVCVGKDFITDTDFSAQDATIDLNKRSIELMLLLQLFDEQWHPLIKDWHYTDYCGRVIYGDPGTKRVKHDFDGSRGSGSPFTTLGNTPLTGLFAYVSLRLSGKQTDDAWSSLGIYSGDDGITADLPPAYCDQAAEFLGFLVKSSENRTYIPFLGRHYFDPINGETSSIQSPLRTLSKLHTTLLNIEEFTAEEAVIMKAICLQVTDKHSDFFGPWSKKILEDAQKAQASCVQDLKAKVLKYPGLHPYFAITALKSNSTFRNSPGDFEELFELEMPGFDWSKFRAWLDNGEGPCPTLWHHPEPEDADMEAVGPVTLAMGGVHDQAQMIEYEEAVHKRQEKARKLPPNAAGPGLFPPAQVDKDLARKKERKLSYKNKINTRLNDETQITPLPRRRRKRSPSEQKQFRDILKEKDLLEQYRAAKIDRTDTLEVQNEKRRVRDKITQMAAPVHKPRCQ
jgi:hypothetical protein